MNPEVIQKGFDLVLAIPAAQALDIALRGVLLFEQQLEIALAARERSTRGFVPSDRLGPTDQAASDGIECRRIALEMRDLLEVSDGRSAPASDAARVRRFSPRQDTRECAFASAVQTDDAHTLTRSD